MAHRQRAPARSVVSARNQPFGEWTWPEAAKLNGFTPLAAHTVVQACVSPGAPSRER